MQNKTTNIRKLTGTAMLGAVAAVLMYMEFPIPIMPSFVKLDVSELPALLAAYAYGPVSGIAVCLIKTSSSCPVPALLRWVNCSISSWVRCLWASPALCTSAARPAAAHSSAQGWAH